MPMLYDEVASAQSKFELQSFTVDPSMSLTESSARPFVSLALASALIAQVGGSSLLYELPQQMEMKNLVSPTMISVFEGQGLSEIDEELEREFEQVYTRLVANSISLSTLEQQALYDNLWQLLD